MKDIEKLFHNLQALSTMSSAKGRKQLLHKISDLFISTNEIQDDEQLNNFEQIMDKLAYELETSVRAELADKLAHITNPPQKLTHKFALDEIDVARPILKSSQILSDNFLVKVAETKSQDHLLAISGRETLSVKITDVLVSRGDQNVLENVSLNKGANISRQGFEKLTESAEHNIRLDTILFNREDAPKDLLKIIKSRVSRTIKAEAFDKGLHITDEEIDETVEKKSSDIDTKDAETAANLEVINKLFQINQLDERVIKHYCTLNQVDETIYALSLITRLPKANVRHCLLTAEIPALAILCKANAFKKATFGSLLELRKRITNTNTAFIGDILWRYDKLQKNTAKRVLAYLLTRETSDDELPQ